LSNLSLVAGKSDAYVGWVEGRDPADQSGPQTLGFVPQPNLPPTLDYGPFLDSL